MHVDYHTTCSLNIARQGNAGEVTKSYSYRTAILNTSNLHGVDNGPVDRRLFKISIFDQTYEEVVDNFVSSML